MALNKFMHPRNPYKDKKPDFKALALKYEEFRKHTTQDSKEHVHLDFKKPECMRALSWALLKEDFGLDIEMPLNRLIPAIPLRLNYILWIEDLLADKHDNVKGIDIGNILFYTCSSVTVALVTLRVGPKRTSCNRALCRIKLLPVTCFGGHMDINC